MDKILLSAFWTAYRESVHLTGVRSLSAALWRRSIHTYIRTGRLQ